MNPAPTGLLDYLPSDAIVLLDDQMAIEDAMSEIEEQAIVLREEQEQSDLLPEDFPLPYLTLVELNDSLSEHRTIDLGSVSQIDLDEIQLADSFAPGPRFSGQLRPLMDHLVERILSHETVVVVSRQAPRLSELWSETDMPRPVLEELPVNLTPGDLHFVHGALSEGWVLDPPDGERINLLTDTEIFGWAKPRPRPRRRRAAAAPELAYADLHTGDWVVHIDYGIGRF